LRRRRTGPSAKRCERLALDLGRARSGRQYRDGLAKGVWLQNRNTPGPMPGIGRSSGRPKSSDPIALQSPGSSTNEVKTTSRTAAGPIQGGNRARSSPRGRDGAALPVNRVIQPFAHGRARQPVTRDPRIIHSLDNDPIHPSQNSISLQPEFQIHCSPWNWPPAQSYFVIVSQDT
jgi:hypothetical protein